MDLNEVCRICLLPKESVQSIFSEIEVPHSEDTKLSKPSIFEILKIFTSISVNPNNDIPNIICCDCLDIVRRSLTFKLKLEKSEAILKELKEGGNTINEWTDSLNEYHDYSEENIKTEKDDYDKVEQTTVPYISRHAVSFEQEFKEEPEIQINIEYCNETDSSENDPKIKNTSNLNGHMLTSTEELAFQCEVCPKKYRFRSSLKEHLKRSHDLSQCTDESLFECEECPKSYRHKWNLTQHMKRAHTTAGIFQCPICSKFLGHKYTLDRHVKNHTKNKVFQCDVCPDNFKSNYHLTKHVRTEHPEGTHNINLICSICSKLFGNEQNLKRHMLIHSEEKPFSCETCGKRFRFKSNLTEHARRIHGVDCRTNNFKFECVICSKFFENEKFLKKHILIIHSHSQRRLFQCEFCPKKVESKDRLTQHMQTVHPICSKLFTQEGNLKEQMNIHTKERPFNRKINDKNFLFKNNLGDHERTEHSVSPTNVRKFQCSICSKVFAQRNDLNRHMVIHTAETSIQCEFCPTVLQSQRELSDHIHTTHTEYIADEKKLKCPICNKLFEFNQQNLKRHMLIHTGEKPFFCEMCKANFRYKSSLSEHMRKMHDVCPTKNEKLECSICSKVFGCKSYLKRHMLSHTTESSIQCDLCPNTFQCKNDLSQHMRMVHSEGTWNNEKFKCQICSKVFPHEYIPQHMLIHTKEKPFFCAICPKNFRFKSNFTEHMRKMHAEDTKNNE